MIRNNPAELLESVRTLRRVDDENESWIPSSNRPRLRPVLDYSPDPIVVHNEWSFLGHYAPVNLELYLDTLGRNRPRSFIRLLLHVSLR